MSERALTDVPPSGKLFYMILGDNGALTHMQIVERSMLSKRTVRDALARLRDSGIITEEVYIPDAR